MKLADFLSYEIHLPTSGGKAGSGRAATSNFQIRKGNQVLKQFRFTVASETSRRAAMQKAKAWMLAQEAAR